MDIIHHCKTGHTESAAVALDFQKAFDSVEFRYIQTLLENMDFGPGFLSVIKNIYGRSKASLKINFGVSDEFVINQGTRQGCPLSPLLFALSIEPLANLIQNTPQIEGIDIAGQTHKISLFADDVVLFISKPMESLQHVLTVLTSFHRVSGLQVNSSKSEIYPIELPESLKQDIKRMLRFPVTAKYWRHLGICIPLQIRNIWQTNLHLVYTEITQLFDSWNKLHLAWHDRLDLVKNFIFPKFLYLFRTIPVRILKKDFKQWQSLLSKFIWSGKPHRLSFRILRRNSRMGGFGIPDLYLFYLASNLVPLVQLLSAQELPQWASIEWPGVGRAMIVNTIWQAKKVRTMAHSHNPYLLTTLKIWDDHRKVLTNGISILSSFLNQEWFSPGRDQPLIMWFDRGVYRIVDLLNKQNTILTKAQLGDQLGESVPWFIYLQLQSMLQIPNIKASIKKGKTDFEVLLESTCGTKGLISQIYQILLKMEDSKDGSLLRKWSQDCHIDITGDIWKQIMGSFMVRTSQMNIKMHSLKLLNRWYLSPDRVRHMIPNSSAECWKQCKLTADYIHAWWQCAKINDFWKEIDRVVTQITGIIIPFTPESYLLNYWPNDEVPADLKKPIAILTATARLEIAKVWKTLSLPKMDSWLERLWHFFLLYKITDRVLLSTTPNYKSRLQSDWAEIVDYLEQQEVVSPGFSSMDLLLF